MTETPKIKGPYKRPSRLKAIVPLEFDYTPGRVGRTAYRAKPRPLRELFELRNKLRPTT